MPLPGLGAPALPKLPLPGTDGEWKRNEKECLRQNVAQTGSNIIERDCSRYVVDCCGWRVNPN